MNEPRLKSTAHALRSLAEAPENERMKHVPNFFDRDGCLEVASAIDLALSRPVEVPIPMRLVCEACGKLHIDEPPFDTKPHHTHSCQHCGITWRPAVVNTVGVRFLPGFKNSADDGSTTRKLTRVVELSRRVAELEAASRVETPNGLQCAFCDVLLEPEDGADPFVHDITCPMKGK